MTRTLVVRQFVIDSILSYAKMAHPREGLLVLQGKNSKDKTIIDNVVIPPLAIHGKDFSSFPLFMLPSALSIIGTAHSHPNGVLRPSIHDLNHFYGRIMIITAYPYESESDLAVFNGKGDPVMYEIA